MIRIEPEQWLPSTYARALHLADILRTPSPDYALLTPADQDKLRQSQIEPGEIVRVLGHHEPHVLMMKSDQVLGWISNTDIAPEPSISAFAPTPSAGLDADEFFKLWRDTPYVWGGITRNGIDCSALTQRYYRDVLNRTIPKNSHDQRRSGKVKTLSDIDNHDLIFCTRIGGRGIHHVGIYRNGDVWHAHGERGVIKQTLSEFLNDYEVLAAINLT